MRLLHMRCKDFKDCKGCPFTALEYEWLCDKTDRGATLAGIIACAEVDLGIRQQSLKNVQEEFHLAEYVEEQPKEEEKHESINCDQ